MAIKFAHPEVDKMYECLAEADITIGVPGNYSGPLSKITPKAAAYMIKVKDKKIRLRPTAKKAAKPPATNADADKDNPQASS